MHSTMKNTGISQAAIAGEPHMGCRPGKNWKAQNDPERFSACSGTCTSFEPGEHRKSQEFDSLTKCYTRQVQCSRSCLFACSSLQSPNIQAMTCSIKRPFSAHDLPSTESIGCLAAARRRGAHSRDRLAFLGDSGSQREAKDSKTKIAR